MGNDDDVFYLFLQKQKIGAELHIYLEEGTYHKRLFRGPNTGWVRDGRRNQRFYKDEVFRVVGGMGGRMGGWMGGGGIGLPLL